MTVVMPEMSDARDVIWDVGLNADMQKQYGVVQHCVSLDSA